MSYSGIVVRAAPARAAALVEHLATLPGIQVHQRDLETGRLILTLEAKSVDDEIDGLRRIQNVPGVVSADLVYHRLQEDAGPSRTTPASATPGTPRGEI